MMKKGYGVDMDLLTILYQFHVLYPQRRGLVGQQSDVIVDLALEVVAPESAWYIKWYSVPVTFATNWQGTCFY